jgi:hypothetical protein
MNFEIKWWQIAIMVLLGAGLGTWRQCHLEGERKEAAKERERDIQKAVVRADDEVSEATEVARREVFSP